MALSDRIAQKKGDALSEPFLQSEAPRQSRAGQAVFTKQLDLFSGSPSSVEPAVPEGETGRVTEWDLLDNNSLVAAPPAAGIRSIVAWAAEVGRRGLPAAVPGPQGPGRRLSGV